MLQAAKRWLRETMDAAAGCDVTYHQGDIAIPWRAVKGQSEVEIVDGDGQFHRTAYFDFLGAADSLAVHGARIRPQAGDTITETADGQTYTYRVVNAEGDAPYKRDRHRVRYRMRTLLVDQPGPLEP